MLRRVLCAALCFAVLLPLLICPAVAQAGAFSAELPMPALLDKLGGGDASVVLLTLADGGYEFKADKIKDGASWWLRVALSKDNKFYGTAVLGTNDSLAEVTALRVDVDPAGRVGFFALPDKTALAAFTVPLRLEGEAALSAFYQGEGGVLTVAQPEPQPPAETEPGLSDAYDRPVAAKVPPAAYILTVLIAFALLAAAVLAHRHSRQLKRLWELGKTRAKLLVQAIPKSKKITPPRKPAMAAQASPKPAEEPPPLLLTDIPPSPAKAVLSGVTVIPDDESGSLKKQIVMKTREEPLPARSEEERMNAFFLGKVFFTPLEHSFLTVGLRNRDALLQAGGEQTQPLFAHNPRGQIFSLEEENGNLYLNVAYFAPPAFVVQSVLRSVCLERVFRLVNAQGEILRMEDVIGHGILGIVPARTARTESGFVLTEQGKLIIGEN